MTNIAFWNVHGNERINDTLVDIITENEVDILGLCEYAVDAGNLVCRNDLAVHLRVVPKIAGNKQTEILYNTQKVSPIGILRDSEHYSIHEFEIEGKSFILAFVHLPSKLKGDNQHACGIQAQYLIRDIEQIEQERKHKRTAIIGDFNLDPFETPLLYCEHFHSYPDRRDTRNERVFQKKSYGTFYNPMWSLFGDRDGPPGTYYYNQPGTAPSWHIFDQIIMRYDVTKLFVSSSLRIIDSTSRYSLASEIGRPDKKAFSDHFPIIFSIGGDAL